ncbi:MAG: hypothetical protein KME19_05680 [Microcoleus vaginatus WJT46-NPBG5]|nr:hypothetical protein [Microcoleus vaginatus WJT46-NPBG5]
MVADPAFAQNVSPDMVCFIQSQNGRMIDQESLCGVVPATAPTTTAAPSTSAPSSLPVPAPPGMTTPSTAAPTNIPPTAASPSTSSGQCNSPNDRAADGIRCEGRASSENPGSR